MSPEKLLALALDPSLILQARGLPPDPWQRDILLSSERQVLLNCSRQSGKSTVVCALALHTALFKPKALVLLLSPSQRQSGEIFRKVTEAYNAIGRPVRATYETGTALAARRTPSWPTDRGSASIAPRRGARPRRTGRGAFSRYAPCAPRS